MRLCGHVWQRAHVYLCVCVCVKHRLHVLDIGRVDIIDYVVFLELIELVIDCLGDIADVLFQINIQ